jgi:hypothetical protein
VARHLVFDRIEEEVEELVPVRGTIVNRRGIKAPGVVFEKKVVTKVRHVKRIVEDNE